MEVALAHKGESLVKLEEQAHELTETLDATKLELTQCTCQLEEMQRKMESDEVSLLWVCKKKNQFSSCMV